MNPKVRDFSRKWHRDIAYFFVGLILSFSISGIALNHRRDYNPREFTYNATPISLNLPDDPEAITEDFIQTLLPKIGMGNPYEGFTVRNGTLRIIYEDARTEVNLKTGQGEKEWVGRKVGLAEMSDLHQTTNKNWIWYSDIFGIAMIFIAISGMFISGGKTSFKKRGWLLAIAGLVFPLIFLFIIV